MPNYNKNALARNIKGTSNSGPAKHNDKSAIKKQQQKEHLAHQKGKAELLKEQKEREPRDCKDKKRDGDNNMETNPSEATAKAADPTAGTSADELFVRILSTMSLDEQMVVLKGMSFEKKVEIMQLLKGYVHHSCPP